MLTGARNAFHLMQNSTVEGTFVPNQNLWLNIYPGHGHKTEVWMTRLWNVMKTISIGRQYLQSSVEVEKGAE